MAGREGGGRGVCRGMGMVGAWGYVVSRCARVFVCVYVVRVWLCVCAYHLSSHII